MNRTEGAAPGSDELAILRLIQRWIVYRDTGDWTRLRAIWHDDGAMTAGWRRGTADEFIAASKARWDDGRIRAMHQLGAVEVEILGPRAISQNKVTILMRAPVEGVLCDVTCQARHLDRWEKRDGLWGLSNREALYDRDRIDAVVPGTVPALDPAVLGKFPEPFRHLGYAFLKLGYPIDPDFPAAHTASGDALLRDWRGWLHA